MLNFKQLESDISKQQEGFDIKLKPLTQLNNADLTRENKNLKKKNYEDKVVWYRYNEECMLLGNNKISLAKTNEAWKIKKLESVIDSDDEW